MASIAIALENVIIKLLGIGVIILKRFISKILHNQLEGTSIVNMEQTLILLQISDSGMFKLCFIFYSTLMENIS